MKWFASVPGLLTPGISPVKQEARNGKQNHPPEDNGGHFVIAGHDGIASKRRAGDARDPREGGQKDEAGHFDGSESRNVG